MNIKEVRNRSAPRDRYHGKINSSCALSIGVIRLKFGPLITCEWASRVIVLTIYNDLYKTYL